MSKRLILCDCSGSQSIDKTVLSNSCGLACSKVYSDLCTTQIGEAAKEIAKGDAVIACLQEQQLFEEIGEEIGTQPVGFVDLRDRAGWSDNGTQSGPKMAALVSDALMAPPAYKALDIYSEGRCLILGSAEIALPAAKELAEVLSVTVLLETADEAPIDRSFDVVIGKLKAANGTLGNFTVTIDALQQFAPGGRGDPLLSAPQNGGQTECDIILDLRGTTTLFPAPHKRDGYLRVDPGDPRAVSGVVFEAAQLVGSFEKPFYIHIEEHLCAHSRAEIAGCSKCLDTCPTSAISPAGEHVSIDPSICAGCGSCAALCPSGAISYDAPSPDYLFRRINNLAQTYLKAGGKAPRLLVHDADFGTEMISLAARYGRGLPSDVIPIEVNALSGFGHAELLAALACGFVRVAVLLSPKTERDALKHETTLAMALSGGERVYVLTLDDPDALSELLYDHTPPTRKVEPILPIGNRRQITRLAAITLNDTVDAPLPLPKDAPYGTVVVDTDACTLCLSCAALCPTGALADNPDKPQLRFTEDACLQCGLCTRVCPEKAITLKPQFDLSDQVFNQQVVHEEEPFACIECGALFGVKSTIEKITEKLAGKHAMFKTDDTARRIQMCDQCRVADQYKLSDNPFQGGERPRVVTTEDYFSKRKDH